MSAAAIKAFGILTFAFEGLMVLTLVGLWGRDGPLPFQGIIRVAGFLFATTVMGVGLVLLRKWAALLFSFALAALLIWLTLAAIGEGALVWLAMVFVLAVVAIAPIVIVIRSWSLLSWRGQ